MRTSLREQVRVRARGLCEYCCAPEDHSSASFTVEHITPRAAQGTDDLDNLTWSCWNCNSHKGAAMFSDDPDTGASVRLYHPRTDLWQEHFRWSGNSLRVEGISPIGRATAERLQMNDPAIVNLRGLLMLIDRHSPHE